MFGRSLGSNSSNSSSISRGPPGIGFKLTADGQFDLERKRLCNVATATHLNDAINLETLQFALQSIEKKIIIRVGTEINKFEKLVEDHRDEIDKELLHIEADINHLKNNSKDGRSSGRTA